MYFFNARWYDSALGRWAQPDSIVPIESQGMQAWDRYAFVNNNPLRYTDPTGHMQACPDGDLGGGCGSSGNISDEEKLEIIRTERDESADEPFDTSLGGNNTAENSNVSPQPAYPSITGLVVTGVIFTVGVVTSEILLTWAEVNMIPVAITTPIIGVSLEVILLSSSLVILDAEISYWVYVARVIQNPYEPHKLELLPPWGLNED